MICPRCQEPFKGMVRLANHLTMDHGLGAQEAAAIVLAGSDKEG